MDIVNVLRIKKERNIGLRVQRTTTKSCGRSKERDYIQLGEAGRKALEKIQQKDFLEQVAFQIDLKG